MGKGGATLAPINADVHGRCAREARREVEGQRDEIKSGNLRVDINEAQPPGSVAVNANGRSDDDGRAGHCRARRRAARDHQALRRPRRQRRHRLRRRARRSPRTARRERRRQDDADADPLRTDAADAGEIRVDGRPVAIRSPQDAIAAGIGMVTQHFALVRPMTVAENLVLGATDGARASRPRRPPREGGRCIGALRDPRRSPRRASTDLSVGEQQRVEILKALSRDCRVLILDEPTAVLVPQEVDALFATLRRLAATGWRLSSSATSCTRCARSATA